MRRRFSFRQCWTTALLGILGLSGANTLPAAEDNAPIYQWQRKYYGKLNGQEQLLYTRGFERSILSFADFDGDGDEDLFVGKSDGRIALFRNPGDNQFRLETEDFSAFQEDVQNSRKVRVKRVIDVGTNAAPTWFDIDDDGDLDLFVGSGDGTIFFYQNRGNALLPVLELVTPAYMNIQVNGNSVPSFSDVNADRAADLLLGNQQGDTKLFYNQGVATRALFCPDVPSQRSRIKGCEKARTQLIGNISPEVDATPTFVDWEGDGDQDILVGKSRGRIDFYLNRGTKLQPEWELESSRFLFINTGGFAAPRFFDVNRDGYPELLIGTRTSRILYYENRDPITTGLKQVAALRRVNLDPRKAPLALMEEACAQIDVFPNCLPPLLEGFGLPLEVTTLEEIVERSLRPSPSFLSTEIGPDVVPDPQASSNAAAPGNMYTMQVNAPVANDEETTTETVEPPVSREARSRNRYWPVTENFFNIGELLPEDRHTLVTAGDWDGDGDPDLLLGSRSGALYAYVNQGGTEDPDWSRVEFPSLAPNGRSFSAPSLADLDGDGDLDILVGREDGTLDLLRNEGSKESPDWQMAEVRFAKIDIGSRSTPLIRDLDGDSDLDLLVGNSQGFLIYFENQGSSEKANFVLESARFANAQSSSGNAVPAIFQWDDDENADLLIGESSGTLQLLTHQPQPNYPVSLGWQQQAQIWQDLETVGSSAPFLVDLNGDQQQDLLVGDEDGHLLSWLFIGKQQPTDIAPPEPVMTANTLERPRIVEGQDFADLPPEPTIQVVPPPTPILPREPIYELVSQRFAGQNFGNRAVPALLDLDGDGDLDLIVGNRRGELRSFQNDPENGSDRWNLMDENFLEYSGGANAAPVFADVDSDGDKDLLVGNESGSVLFWENRGTPEFPEFFRDPRPMNGVTSGRNSIPAIYDVNQDGRADLLLGNFGGNMRLYLQEANGTGFRFRLYHRRFLDLDVGLGAVPVFADFNNDQQNELVVGSDAGRLIEFRPADATQDTPWGWKLNDGPLAKLSMPVGGVPVFVDYDSDGDLDLIVGTEAGDLQFYRNKAIEEN